MPICLGQTTCNSIQQGWASVKCSYLDEVFLLIWLKSQLPATDVDNWTRLESCIVRGHFMDFLQWMKLPSWKCHGLLKAVFCNWFQSCGGWSPSDSKTVYDLQNRAGRSPTFWTCGLSFSGLAGTHGLAGPIQDLEVDLDKVELVCSKYSKKNRFKIDNQIENLADYRF